MADERGTMACADATPQWQPYEEASQAHASSEYAGNGTNVDVEAGAMLMKLCVWVPPPAATVSWVMAA
jgi:hypothetical protein